jgi:3-phosphoshikimate 1-carboxyvinyltransferase
MTESLLIPTVAAPVTGTADPPGSKSITNRALVCAALARGQSTLTGVLDSDDTRVMVAGLAGLGAGMEADWPAQTITVTGTHGAIPAREATIDCTASGTTMRFLSAVCGLGIGTYRLDGTARMRKRPIGDLLEALRDQGIEAIAESPGGCPPVVIRSKGLRGGRAQVRSETSSQFASGLALAAPCSEHGMEIMFSGRVVSLPYLDMTRQVMESFGATCEVLPDGTWRIPPSGYVPQDYRIEPDASAASYFTAAAAITGGRVRVEGLGRESLQGDIAFCHALEQMGCIVSWEPRAVTVAGRATRGIDIDMNAISDTVPTLAVVALFADGPMRIRNVAHVRDKETDRISDLVRELRRLGADVDEHADGLTVWPSGQASELRGARIRTYDDHRMAMSLSLAGLRVPGVEIEDPLCVGKTFPGYWKALASLAEFPATFLPPG